MAKHVWETLGGKVTEIENKLRTSEIEKRARSLHAKLGELDVSMEQNFQK